MINEDACLQSWNHTKGLFLYWECEEFQCIRSTVFKTRCFLISLEQIDLASRNVFVSLSCINPCCNNPTFSLNRRRKRNYFRNTFSKRRWQCPRKEQTVEKAEEIGTPQGTMAMERLPAPTSKQAHSNRGEETRKTADKEETTLQDRQLLLCTTILKRPPHSIEAIGKESQNPLTISLSTSLHRLVNCTSLVVSTTIIVSMH